MANLLEQLKAIITGAEAEASQTPAEPPTPPVPVQAAPNAIQQQTTAVNPPVEVPTAVMERLAALEQAVKQPPISEAANVGAEASAANPIADEVRSMNFYNPKHQERFMELHRSGELGQLLQTI